VPGFATTLAPVATAPPAPKVVSVPSRAVADPGTLMAIAVAAAALASIFVVIIFAGPPREGGRARRLAAFGRRQAVEEKRSFIGRIPLLRRFSEQAEAVAKKRGLLGALNTALEQADIPLSPGEAVAGAMAGAVVLGLAVGLMATSVLLGLLAFVVGVLLVLSAVRFIGAREKRRFENQLPDTLTLISTSLRAGYSLLQAVEAVAEESPSPTSREFARAIAESRLGRPVVAAMQAMGQRMQSADFTWAVMAIEIQREVGGNLAEVLQIVADTMRQRNRLKGEIRALTAEGRISAVVLAMLPIGMFAFLWVSNRSYLEPLLTNSVGWLAIGAGIMAMGIGIYWMRKIVNIEV
ncbi:MAG: type II secretion system F family protein, partial [Acidimicrobiia bacterium]